MSASLGGAGSSPATIAITPPAAQIPRMAARVVPNTELITLSRPDPRDPSGEMVAEEDHQTCQEEEPYARPSPGHDAEVVRCDHVQQHGQDDREKRDDPGRGAPLGCDRIDLAFDADPLADRV